MTNPLTLIMPLNPGTTLKDIGGVLVANQAAIDKALTSIGTVHFARFVVFENSAQNLLPGLDPKGPLCLSVITEYDGNFDAYIQDFVNQIGDVFNALLAFVVGGSALVPVQNNVEAFTDFIKQNDASQNVPNDGLNLYAAYPCTVQQVLAANPCPEGS
ncbi:MAG TPA: hypothetical protein VHL54_05700 [Actinomycetota bacterium]|nr:hypothetical protein [Actinomycetota bacterium]